MTVFADALDLRTAVFELVGRSDLSDVWPRLVKLAEVGINRRLRCREQITIATVNIVSGAGNLPADFEEVIGVYDGAGVEYIAQPVQAVKTAQNRGYYAISGNQIIARIDEVLMLEYYASVPTLGDNHTATNWVLTKHPGLYLYAVGTEAAKHVKDVEAASTMNQLAEMEYVAVAAEDAQQRYSRARVRMRLAP
jgi:hypothetical protein